MSDDIVNLFQSISKILSSSIQKHEYELYRIINMQQIILQTLVKLQLRVDGFTVYETHVYFDPVGQVLTVIVTVPYKCKSEQEANAVIHSVLTIFEKDFEEKYSGYDLDIVGDIKVRIELIPKDPELLKAFINTTKIT